MTEAWNHAGVEPSVKELLADPICRRIMQCDGIEPNDVWSTIRSARRRHAGRASGPTQGQTRTSLDYLVEAREMRARWAARVFRTGLEAAGRRVSRAAGAATSHFPLRGPALAARP